PRRTPGATRQGWTALPQPRRSATAASGVHRAAGSARSGGGRPRLALALASGPLKDAEPQDPGGRERLPANALALALASSLCRRGRERLPANALALALASSICRGGG